MDGGIGHPWFNTLIFFVIILNSCGVAICVANAIFVLQGLGRGATGGLPCLVLKRVETMLTAEVVTLVSHFFPII